MKLIYLKSVLKSDSFDVSIGIKLPFSRVSVTIEPGRSLLTVRYHELFDMFASISIHAGTILRKFIKTCFEKADL
jgi:hypothetical protein